MIYFPGKVNKNLTICLQRNLPLTKLKLKDIINLLGLQYITQQMWKLLFFMFSLYRYGTLTWYTVPLYVYHPNLFLYLVPSLQILFTLAIELYLSNLLLYCIYILCYLFLTIHSFLSYLFLTFYSIWAICYLFLTFYSIWAISSYPLSTSWAVSNNLLYLELSLPYLLLYQELSLPFCIALEISLPFL